MKKLGTLEALRGLCALYVFLGHFALTGVGVVPAWASVFRFGQEAVIVFFLMSGFVINLSTARHRNQSFGDYIQRRAIRIFPIFALALILGGSIVFATTGPNESISLSTLTRNILMLQDFGNAKPGTWAYTFAANGPLWSLSYEWWFYVMFWPIRRYISARWQTLFVAALSGVGFVWTFTAPAQPGYFLLYFTIWWAGVSASESYLESGRLEFRKLAASYVAIFALFIALLGASLDYRRKGLTTQIGLHPLLETRHYLMAFVCLSMLLVGERLLRYSGVQKFWREFVRWVLLPFERIAPISYGIYVLHWPLAISAKELFAGWPLIVTVPLRIAAVLLVSIFAEGPYQRFFSKRLGSAPPTKPAIT